MLLLPRLGHDLLFYNIYISSVFEYLENGRAVERGDLILNMERRVKILRPVGAAFWLHQRCEIMIAK